MNEKTIDQIITDTYTSARKDLEKRSRLNGNPTELDNSITGLILSYIEKFAKDLKKNIKNDLKN